MTKTKYINKQDIADTLLSLKTAKADEAYHRKKMEYNQELIKIYESYLGIK